VQTEIHGEGLLECGKSRTSAFEFVEKICHDFTERQLAGQDDAGRIREIGRYIEEPMGYFFPSVLRAQLHHIAQVF